MIKVNELIPGDYYTINLDDDFEIHPDTFTRELRFVRFDTELQDPRFDLFDDDHGDYTIVIERVVKHLPRETHPELYL